MKDRLIALAREAGFPRAAFASLAPVTQEGELHPNARALTGDAASLMEGAACVMLLAMPYQPFAPLPGEASVDAYYLTSNAAHQAVSILASRIEAELNLRALPSPPVFYKPLAVRSGLGEFGRNGLISVGELGTRVALQAILLNADIPVQDRAEPFLSPQCAHCHACMDACPVHALRGDGSVDIVRCLRAQPEGEAFPERLRTLLGECILGCDWCQRVCPRNAQVQTIAPPRALRDALDLKALLSGVYRPLIPFLGANNARKQRVTARALLAAANLNRRDLLPEIQALAEQSESAMVREHARWALAQLQS